jgi:hypothetical protein
MEVSRVHSLSEYVPEIYYYNTFYSHNFRIFVISQIVGLYQDFPLWSNGKEPTLEWSM